MALNDYSVSRRRFIEAMGVAFGASAVGLAGCGSKRAGEAGSAAAGGSADTITFAQGADPRGLDPAFVDDGESAKVMANVYDTLLRYDTDSCDLVPGIAKSYEVSDDGLTYTFTLNEGVTFHDGTACDAAAVKANIDRQLEPARTEDMPYASFVFGSEELGSGVASVEAADATTLVIKMRSASTPFLKNLAMPLAAPIVSPAAIEAGDANEKPVGSGPYQFVSWTKGDSIVLKAYDDFWDDDRAAKTKNVIFRIIAENASRVTALNNGEVDIIDGLDASVVKTVTDAGNKLFQKDGMNINYLAFRTDSGVFTNPDARRAFIKAVNVEELVKSLYGEYASPANSVMPDWMAPYVKDVKQTSYDPDAAKQELAALGITSLTMLAYTNVRPYNSVGGQALAEAIQGYLADAGVDVQIVSYDWTTYKTKTDTDSFDCCLYGWVGDNGDPDNFMNLLADESTAMNVARYRNDAYNALIAQGLATPDGDARDQVYLQCEQIVAEDAPWMLISHAQTLAAYSSKVSGFSVHPTGMSYLQSVTKQA